MEDARRALYVELVVLADLERLEGSVEISQRGVARGALDLACM